MTDEELAQAIAQTIGDTGIEGGYGSISKSTAGNYPSGGISQWEGSRLDNLLSYIDGGSEFAGRTYTDLLNNGDIGRLRELLDSEQGHAAQQAVLAGDTLHYVELQHDIPGNDDSRVIIYIGTWQPTSSYLPVKFLLNRLDRVDIHSLEAVHNIFITEYADAAGCSAYAVGYSNRGTNAYQYVAGLDLSSYGVPAYGEGPYGR